MLIIGTTPFAAAQDAPPPAAATTRHFGIGAVVNATTNVFIDDEFVLVPLFGGTVLFPIASKAFTLEPEVGLFRFHNSFTSGSFSSSTDGTVIRIGVGALFGGRARGDLKPYIGPRAGIVRSSVEETNSGGGPNTTTTRTSIYIAFVAGAQYFFSPHFSLGGEAQLQHVSLGDEKVTPTSGSGSTTELSFTSTAAVAILRFFY